jgi:hypothetical protein
MAKNLVDIEDMETGKRTSLTRTDGTMGSTMSCSQCGSTYTWVPSNDRRDVGLREWVKEHDKDHTKLPVEEMTVKRLWLHVTVNDGLEVKSYASLKSGNEVRDYFGNNGPHLPCGLPEEFSKLYVRCGKTAMDGSNEVTTSWTDVIMWGEESACVDGSDVGQGTGMVVEADGVELLCTWKEEDDE